MSSVIIKIYDEIAHFLRNVLLQPSTILLDKFLIITTVRCTITDNRDDAVLQIFLGDCNIIVAEESRADVGSSRGDVYVEAPNSTWVKIAATQRTG
jgi:hypothetical protein